MTLLDDSYPEGLPPYLVSHVLDQVHWHCRFLREHNLQHTDLELDGSVCWIVIQLAGSLL
jgi:hypothetical protein